MRFHFILLLVPLSWLGACDPPRLATAVAPGRTVLAFGDSVTHGTGAGPGEDWPALLARATGWTLVNAGQPGDTALAGRSRLPGLLARHRPALVIIEMGGNDFLRRRPAGEVKEDLRHLVRTARQAGAQVVLVGVPEPSLLALVAGHPDDAPLFAELGEEEHVPVIGDVLSAVLSNPEWRADSIHPNAAGYRRMAAGLLDRMRAIGLIGEAGASIR